MFLFFCITIIFVLNKTTKMGTRLQRNHCYGICMC